MKYCAKCGASLATKNVAGVMRLVCSDSECGFIFWDNPVPVVAALVEYEKKILLACNREWPPHTYSVVTGYLERGETPEQAVIREVKEELDLDADLGRFIGHFSLLNRNQIILAYRVVAGGEIRLNDELTAFKLWSHRELAALTPVEVSTPISPVYRRSGTDGAATVLPLTMWCWKRALSHDKSRQ